MARKIGILGTGMVGSAIGAKLVQLGYEVRMGSRTANNEKAAGWAKAQGVKASHGTFEDAAKFGDIIFLCTKGDATLEALKLLNAESLKGKTVIDISNPLDFSRGMPPTLVPKFTNTNSLAEEVQKALPASNVVKSLNIVNCEVMVNPKRSGGDPTMFVAGNSGPAKEEVKGILKQFGWSDVIDLGDISGARGMEMILPIWLRTWGAIQNGYFGFKIVR